MSAPSAAVLELLDRLDEFIEEDQLAQCEAMLRKLIAMARRGALP